MADQLKGMTPEQKAAVDKALADGKGTAPVLKNNAQDVPAQQKIAPEPTPAQKVPDRYG